MGTLMQRVASRYLVAVAGYRIKKDLVLKNGDTIPKGTSTLVRFLGEHDPKGRSLCDLAINWTSPTTGRDYSREPLRTSIMRLPDQVTGFTRPSFARLEKMVDDGVATTPTGKRVEPDGYGPDKSPSWLLILGYI